MLRYYILLYLSLVFLAGCWFFKPPPPTIPPTQPPPQPIPWEDVGIPELKKRLYAEDAERRVLAADQLIARGKKKTIKIITHALDSNRDDVIFSILKALTQRHEERLIEPVIKVLETKDEKFQPLIFEIFHNHPDRERLVKILLEHLNDLTKTTRARKMIVRALGYVPSKNAVEPLITFYLNPQDELSRQIAWSLERITRHRFTTREEWIEWWAANKDRPREVWLDEAINTYEKLFQTKDQYINDLLAEIVELKIEALASRIEEAKKLQPPEGVLTLLMGALDDKYPPVKKYALEQLRNLPKDKLKPVIPKILEIIKDTSEEVRQAAITTLGEIGDEEVLGTFISILHNQNESITLRQHTARAIGKIKSPQTTLALTNLLLKENNPALQLTLIDALGEIKDKNAVPILIECLETPSKSDEIHRAIIDLLGEIKDPQSVPVLIKFIDDPRDRFRWSAANSLGKIGDPQAVEPLIKLLDDPYVDIRQITAEALGNLADKRAILPLVKVLFNDKDTRARELAAIALGKINQPESLPHLTHALTDPDDKVRIAVWNAIISIASKDLTLLEELAQCLEALKQYSHLAEVYRQIIEEPLFKKPELERRLALASARLGVTLVALKNFKEAIPYLETACQKFPQENLYPGLLLQCYESLAQWNEAQKIIKNLLTKYPKDSQEWWQLKKRLVSVMLHAQSYVLALEEIKILLAGKSIPPDIKTYLEKLAVECEKALQDQKKQE